MQTSWTILTKKAFRKLFGIIMYELLKWQKLHAIEKVNTRFLFEKIKKESIKYGGSQEEGMVFLIWSCKET